ncbi:MAG: hypothetical protein ACRDQT_03900 [Gaiellaceae bacterium]
MSDRSSRVTHVGDRWRRPARVAAFALIVVAAAFSTALAIDLLRADRHFEAADVRFTTRLDRAVSWTPDTALPAGLSRSVLGLDDDLEYRGAVQQFWLSNPRAPLRQFSDVTRRAAAERRLAELSDESGNDEHRSLLFTMRGGLLLEEARATPSQREVFVRRAIEQFQSAIAQDPSNDDAVHDLELSLKLLRQTGRGDAGETEGRAPLPSAGAGAATQGGGF